MNNELKIIRGDTKAYEFNRQTLDNSIITWKPDEMYITLKKDAYSKNFIWQKKLSTNEITYDEEKSTYRFQIEAADTQELPYGVYVIDISYKKDTIIQTIYSNKVILDKEVTFYNNM